MVKIEWKRMGHGPVLRTKELKNEDGTALPVLVAPKLEELQEIRHFFTTREGGVSSGIFRSLNLTTSRGDDPANVAENFTRVSAALGVPKDHFVLTRQTHTDNIHIVTEEDAGRGLTRDYGYTDVDGLVTNVPGIALSVFTADCVPILFADPVHKAIGTCHAGWRGTAARIAEKVIRIMKEQYGTDPADVRCAIGPSICRACYEVSGDVAEAFAAALPGHEAEIMDEKNVLGEKKYQLDLHLSNRIILEEAGVRPEHIDVTDICTQCNPDLLWSHRATNGQRGLQAGFIVLE